MSLSSAPEIMISSAGDSEVSGAIEVPYLDQAPEASPDAPDAAETVRLPIVEPDAVLLATAF